MNSRFVLLALLALEGAAMAEDLPGAVDLRPAWAALELSPKSQAPRGTCSVFAVTAMLEFELARPKRHAVRLSEEFVNWASHHTNGRASDGSFFSDAIVGVQTCGAPAAELLPYAQTFDPALQPAAPVLADALARRGVTSWWIKLWDVHTGMSDAMLRQVKESLAAGHPVALGMRWPDQERYDEHGALEVPPADKVFDGHSVVLVGYADDPMLPGGGAFIFRNSFGPGWRDGGHALLPYAYAAAYGNDAVGLRVDGRPGRADNRGVKGGLDFERLAVVERRGVERAAQEMTAYGDGWDGAQQLFCGGTEGGSIAFELPVDAGGLYQLDLYATRAPDFATLRIAVDGLVLLPALDLFGPQVVPTGRVRLGVMPLKVGRHALQVHAATKNPAAQGWHFGLDAVTLERVSAE
ncbi:MAG: C1 family peptidase [Armatimonadetes bacterium]|nr:C1 family peptidase [Armatimonadota bacterium]